MNPLLLLRSFGQSFWYDNIRRKYLLDGTLRDLVVHDDLRGVTSNPSIFKKAIGDSDDYDKQISALGTQSGSVEAIYENLAIQDIRSACDIFANVYHESQRVDGYVSLEVSPHLAHDTRQTVAEAKRLFAAVDRPNVMIKVPATPAGVKAVEQLISAGVNVNATLMFSMDHYNGIAQAYINGLHRYLQDGGNPGRVASVASFFVSRVDTAVDSQLAVMDDPRAMELLGKTAIANSKIVYQRFKSLFYGDEFDSLRSAGARVQRLLWASTSTKNPKYPDTMYVDHLIGPETVNTMPPETIEAFRHHGVVANTLEAGLDEALNVLETLTRLGIDLDSVTEQLQHDGVTAFANAYDDLLSVLHDKVETLAIAE